MEDCYTVQLCSLKELFRFSRFATSLTTVATEVTKTGVQTPYGVISKTTFVTGTP